MGDNGYFLGERGYAGKWLLYEQSIRVPLIIYDPRQPETKRGKTFQEMVLNVDVTPTILKLAGIKPPERYQGESLTAFFDHEPNHWRTGIFLEHRLENNVKLVKTDGFRDETYKFIRYDNKPNLIELYNFEEDKNETKNLALDKNYSDKVKYYRNKCDSAVAKLLSDRIRDE